MKHIAVIGGNAAGPSAAAKAKRVNPNAEVVLFEAGNFISTGTCELPYLLSGEIKDYHDIIFYTPESFYEEKKVKVYTRHFVERIDRREKRIIINNLESSSSFEYNFDKLVLATGAHSVRHPAFNKSYKNVFYLKSVNDFLMIRDFLSVNKVNNVLIIGGGYIGIEMADSFRILGKQVSIIDKEALPFSSMDLDVRSLAGEILASNEVEFIGGVTELNVYDNSDYVTKVKFNSVLHEYDLILISAGFSPNANLAVGAKIDIGKFGGIHVDSKLKTSDSNIFAAGDCIEIQNRITGRYELMPLASIAHTYGHVAGANAAGDNLHAEAVIKNTAVKLFNRILISVGLNSKEAQDAGYSVASVSAIMPNLVNVMPESRKIFGKIIFEKGNQRILGAQFLGGKEVTGYGDIISSLIYQKSDVSLLGRINYNYSPPCSPFVNILSVLGRKTEGINR